MEKSQINNEIGFMSDLNQIATKTEELKGRTRLKLYAVWSQMKARCHNPSHRDFKDYGQRGIIVCDDWKRSFTSFYNWASSHGYAEGNGLTLERCDTNASYAPQNCRFATRKEQARNRRSNVPIIFDGRIQLQIDWMIEFGINFGSIRHWKKKGLSLPQILEKFRARQQREAA